MAFIRATATATPRGNRGQFIQSRVTPAVRAGVVAFLGVAHEEAQANVRVKTGRLKASGTEDPFPQDEPGGIRIIETAKTVRGELVYTAPYASFVEFRFSFLRSALDTARDAGMVLFRGQVSAAMK